MKTIEKLVIKTPYQDHGETIKVLVLHYHLDIDLGNTTKTNKLKSHKLKTSMTDQVNQNNCHKFVVK